MDKNEALIKHELLTSICKRNFLYICYTHPNTDKPDTFFWIGINNIDIENSKVSFYGYNLKTNEGKDFPLLPIDNIKNAKVVDETYYSTDESESLLKDIKTNPEKYENLFGNYLDNNNILDYYEECIKLNNTPYLPDEKFKLISKLDEDSFINNYASLTNEQFNEIIDKLNEKLKDKNENIQKKTLYLCLNLLTIRDSKKGNYVVAYKKLSLDIKKHSLKIDENITICKQLRPLPKNEKQPEFEEEFKNIEKNSLLQYFENDELPLLEDFENNQEQIKNILSKNLPYTCMVDDNPYIFPLQRELIFNLKNEFTEIKKMDEEQRLTEPLKAFFGRLIKISNESTEYPIVLLDDNANMKQLLAIQNAMQNPVSYIQGPPGTGKTSTIVNTILTAFFNNQTVLFTAYNNKPIDGVTEKLKKITYRNYPNLFPFLVIKRNQDIPKALEYVRQLYEIAKSKTVQKEKLELKKDLEISKTKQITELLKEYEKKVELEETAAVLDKMLEKINSMQFNLYLDTTEKQKIESQRKLLKEIDCKETVGLINENKNDFFMYIYFRTVELLQQLDLPEYADFKSILYETEPDKQEKAFNDYLKDEDNIYKLLKVFPVILSTCITARKISLPKQFFDITIMDEASQCDNATAIIPIIRGKKLMLVGDPNQLNPVIVLDKSDDERLKQEYQIPQSYDFLNNSVYKTFIANDSISNEILLSYHYRCAPKIIQFNNKKYYNNKLNIETMEENTDALSFIEIENNESTERNTSPKEIDAIIDYVKNNQDKSIGIITPFRNQRKGIIDRLNKLKIEVNTEKSNISCGTVHSFQGDEKDQIIFSLALTNKTSIGTYNWLKCNKELINVATSRSKNKLILLSSTDIIESLHNNSKGERDDIYDLYQYVKSEGKYDKITSLNPETRALGLKAYTSETESEFLDTLENALDKINIDKKIKPIHEVSLASIFTEDYPNISRYFLESRFDFVLFDYSNKKNPIPLIAFEVDGIEHKTDKQVIERDKKKEAICKAHNFTLVRVPNSYARRYKYIKKILQDFFMKN